MQQTTRVRDPQQAEPPAGAGPYEHNLPVTHVGGQPLPAPRPARKAGGLSWMSMGAIFFVSIAAQALRDWSGLPMLHCQMILYCIAFVFMYWDTPKPRQGFFSWTLKVVGIFLNAFVALVTMPQSLRGLLPDSLAFSLPVFAFLLIYYWLSPRIQRYMTPSLWQWLLYAAGFAAFWGWVGPGAVN